MSFTRYELREYGFIEELFGYGLKWYMPCKNMRDAVLAYKSKYQYDGNVHVYKVTYIGDDEIVEKFYPISDYVYQAFGVNDSEESFICQHVNLYDCIEQVDGLFAAKEYSNLYIKQMEYVGENLVENGIVYEKGV